MLYIFVEGPDDEDFFEKLFGKCFGEHKIIRYANRPHKEVNNFIRAISNNNNEYLFFGDEDGKGAHVKQKTLLNRYRDLSERNLFIVQFEIESWYYAGLSSENYKKLKMKKFQYDTNSLSKEQFYSKLIKSSDRKYIMSQILTSYSIELAKERNASFRDFLKRIKNLPLFDELQVTAN